ncbi:MAG: PTS sugar transporter subunit IIA [Lachnospiraceae bacterium]
MFGKVRELLRKEDKGAVISAPVEGEVVSSDKINDPTFSEQLLGKTIGIIPSGERVVAPVNGVIDSVFETGHAVTVISDEGAQIIIHVGLDTVNLKGKHFTVHAKAGDKVRTGNLLLEFDRQGIIADGYDPITIVIICNSGESGQIDVNYDISVMAGDPIMKLKK